MARLLRLQNPRCTPQPLPLEGGSICWNFFYLNKICNLVHLLFSVLKVEDLKIACERWGMEGSTEQTWLSQSLEWLGWVRAFMNCMCDVSVCLCVRGGWWDQVLVAAKVLTIHGPAPPPSGLDWVWIQSCPPCGAQVGAKLLWAALIEGAAMCSSENSGGILLPSRDQGQVALLKTPGSFPLFFPGLLPHTRDSSIEKFCPHTRTKPDLVNILA